MNNGQQGQGDDQLRMQGQQPSPHRRCPRCNSNNTKFCYFNNYSLSQPRYFCKACKRYWTHGGILRNIPIGGNSRRGKHSRNSNSQQPPPQQPQPTIITYVAPPPPPPSSTIEPGVVSTGEQSSMTSSYYGDGGGEYVSTLTAMHDVNQPQGFNDGTPTLNYGGDSRGGGSNSNLGLLQGFNIPHIQAAQVYQMGNNKANTLIRSVYPPPIITSTTTSSSSHEAFTQAGNNMAIPDWCRGFASRANSTSGWSISSTTTIANSSGSSNNANGRINCGSSSFGHAARWPDVPGFGHQ